ncbi:hypothetical protein GGF46_000124 [Coemansia sp. RSA 552]|nr:hypothetical protein GGF46_000124 [Coemansia sp. RSA 552]
MDAESSYWDQYCDDSDYSSPAILPMVPAMVLRSGGLDDSGSSRDSYWSRYSTQQFSPAVTGEGGMERRQPAPQQPRLLVVPERLAALRLDSSEQAWDCAGDSTAAAADPPPLTRGNSSSSSSSSAGACSIGHGGDSIGGADPLPSPSFCKYAGVNPAALITRLNFLKEQMEQSERLLLNSVV